eukprot:s2927_g5.t1
MSRASRLSLQAWQDFFLPISWGWGLGWGFLEPSWGWGVLEPPCKWGFLEPPWGWGFLEPPWGWGFLDTPSKWGFLEPPWGWGFLEPPLQNAETIPKKSRRALRFGLGGGEVGGGE